MILYHGSSVVVEKPLVSKFRESKDVMNMLADKTLLNMKYARVIMEFSRITGISTNDALRIFYHSDLYFLMKNGISDIHCMSDNWLAEELKEEYENKKAK